MRNGCVAIAPMQLLLLLLLWLLLLLLLLLLLEQRPCIRMRYRSVVT